MLHNVFTWIFNGSIISFKYLIFLELQAVRNIKHDNEQVEAKKGITSASQCEGDKAVFTLTGKLAVLVFNIKIQAQSRG